MLNQGDAIFLLGDLCAFITEVFRLPPERALNLFTAVNHKIIDD